MQKSEGRIPGKDLFGWFIVCALVGSFRHMLEIRWFAKFHVLPCMALNSLEVGREICCVLM